MSSCAAILSSRCDWPRTISTFSGPAKAGQAFGHHLGGEGIELQLFAIQLGQDFGARGVDGAPAQPRAQIISCFRQGRNRQARRGVDDAVFHLAVFADHDHQRLARRDGDEFDMLERAVLLGRDHQPGAARQARRDCVAWVSTSSMRWPLPDMRASMATRSSGASSPISSNPSTNSRSPFRWAPAPRWCAGHRAGPSLPGRPSHCGWTRATAPRGRRWDRVRDPTGSPEARKASTRWRKTSRGRSVRPVGYMTRKGGVPGSSY